MLFPHRLHSNIRCEWPHPRRSGAIMTPKQESLANIVDLFIPQEACPNTIRLVHPRSLRRILEKMPLRLWSRTRELVVSVFCTYRLCWQKLFYNLVNTSQPSLKVKQPINLGMFLTFKDHRIDWFYFRNCTLCEAYKKTTGYGNIQRNTIWSVYR